MPIDNLGLKNTIISIFLLSLELATFFIFQFFIINQRFVVIAQTFAVNKVLECSETQTYTKPVYVCNFSNVKVIFTENLENTLLYKANKNHL